MIRLQYGLSISRFCTLVDVPRGSYYRRLHRADGDDRRKGPWPAPVVERISADVKETAGAFPAWGHRKIWALLGYDGINASQSSVERSMRRQQLLLPVAYQRQRRALAAARRAAFVTPPERRNQLWQMDFSEYETEAGLTWQLCHIVDYWAKICLASVATTTKTTHDATAALRLAVAEAERLLALDSLRDDLALDADTGQPRALIIVSDNGPCFKSGGFAAHIARSEGLLAHVRTRHRAPETNGVVERFIGSVTYEHLHRHEIADGLVLQDQLDAYRELYNTVRPHEAIAFNRPLDRYLDPHKAPEANLEPA